jgi:hypothetical protein
MARNPDGANPMVGRLPIGMVTAITLVALSTTAFAQNPHRERLAVREVRMLSRPAENLPQFGQRGKRRVKIRPDRATQGVDTMAQFQEVQF